MVEADSDRVLGDYDFAAPDDLLGPFPTFGDRTILLLALHGSSPLCQYYSLRVYDDS